MKLLLLWLVFLLCTAAILYSGTRLSRYGDIIAEKTGLGRVWIGAVLLAFITSLPELVTGISSIVISRVPDIAAGDVFGSCVYNMLILAMLDVFDRASPISSRVHQRHTLSAGFCILFLSIAAAGIFLSGPHGAATHGPDGGSAPRFLTGVTIFGWVGLYTPLILLLYILAVRLIFVHEKRAMSAFVKGKVKELKYSDISKRNVYRNFIINAVVVVLAAVLLPEVGASLAEITGLGQTFMGNVLIAVSTSLPELVVSVMALRIGAGDMAIGNLFGSNIFNIGILAVDDLFYLDGPLLSFIDTTHIVSALSAVIMTTVAVIGLTYRARKKALFISWDAAGIVAVYILNIMVLYVLR